MTYTDSQLGASLRANAEKYADMRLRSKVLHWETKDLMRAPDPRPRDLVPMPGWPTRGPKSAVKNGYIVGSRAHAAARAMGLSSFGQAHASVVGMVDYVPSANGTKPSAKAVDVQPKAKAAREAIRPRLDGTRPVVLSDHELMTALGISAIRMAEVD